LRAGLDADPVIVSATEVSREQANSFKKHRDAEDPQENLTWAARFGQKALRASPEALALLDVERDFELGDEERILWRLLKLPRKYVDLECTALLSIAKCRAFFRGLVAADVVDIVEVAQAKALLPTEVTRLKAEIAGKELPRLSGRPLKARVYRPDIDTPRSDPSPSPAPAHAEAPPPPRPSPAPVPPAPASAARATPPASPPAPRVTAAPAPAAAMGAEEQALKDEIERAFVAMPKQNHYEFMGVARGAADAAVRTAYLRLAREYHPDRVAGGAFAADASIRTKVDGLFKRLGEAHEALATAETRGAYDRLLDALGPGGVASASGKKQRRPFEANNAFKMAETYFKKKDMKQAEAHYRQAVTFDGEDPKILTALAWCIWQNPDHVESERTAEAKKRLTDIVTTHRFADAAYKLGLMLRRANDEAAAQRQFAVALKLDPAHVESSREVRLSDSRLKKAQEEKKDAGGGFLGKLGIKK
jgi:curved DNA-binding protein CbpA